VYTDLQMADRPPPEYKVYRSRRSPLAGRGGLEALRGRLRRPRRGRPGAPRRGVDIRRAIKWVAIAVVAWLVLSLVLFMISAQLENGVSHATKKALSPGGSLLTGSTILVLGNDQRIGKSIDKSQTGAPRADSIMLLHVGFGSVRKLSIPRDSFAQIPGHFPQKINAAYAFGGDALMIRTVERFMGNGLRINHVIDVNFKNFPALIDALGGITVNSPTKVCSPPFDNFWKGLTFKKGENHLNGTRALGFARVRHNNCAPRETDLDRARRQQEVLSGIRHKLLSPTSFFRLPLVSWRAPKTLRSDMHGPGLFTLFTDVATGGSGKPKVLTPSCLGCGPGNSLLVSAGARRDAVQKLLGR
jgi:LCP family protein required for cell wall assembly